ncbi:E3 ubiquitin-protein ligase listerin-like [Papaver somniferum]|uniref:E3 ubiquitin-protein ligase listerin-like n=1 Tax=Papaver somniferum TaxID=3469 RepID=UPI000E700623|nr:E3 ubiquitin-protein ligase listerin-like [Papaver somniferum]XP_026457016.1 E3 ubiquitin-protein ligase listerin-like [Papaver somniferum]
MGKQKGDGARSKNRPSSSSLAASLLPTGAATVGFGGFVGSSRLESTTTLTPDSNPFSDVDSEVAQHLKRLGRKDPTTKLKALTTLQELFKQKSGEDIVQIIPQWAFEYKRLLLEYNREVRRATHETMTSLVTAVGRGLAPHLKSLMGPWWFSQFDPVSEISQAARRSFQDAFAAPEKRLDALILCTSEIFLYLEENLKLTPQTISDKATPVDELEEMHQRVVSSSLLALATLLDILLVKQQSGLENVKAEPKNASKARATAVSSAEKIFSGHKYLTEFLKSKSPVIRAATYSALGSFIKHIPEVINEGNMKLISAAILGSFQEKDPTCHSPMWETVLLFSKKYPESWAPANIQKTVLNRFWQFLRNGCYGTQQISYPMLVPFINTIPPKSLKGNEFFLDFFQNLWAGRNTSYSSSADRLAFFKAFRECFIWAIENATRYFDGEDAVHQFRVGLVVSILVDLLWKSFLLLDSSKSQDGVLPQKSCGGSPDENIQSSQGQKLEKQNIKFPLHYMQNLGECIIEILSVISGEEHSLLTTFCATFQENTLEFLQQTEQSRPSEQISQTVSFLLLLEKHAVKKGEMWPLVYLTGPMLTKAFPVIKSLDSPDAVRILSVSVSIFGPRSIVSQLHSSEEMCSGAPSKEGDNDYETKHFMQVFKETFVPWCLHGSSLSVGARLDLLLALLDDQHFPEQWSSIITFANRSLSNGLDSDSIDMLAVLIEKVRRAIGKNEGTKYFRPGSNLEKWHHNLLDSIATNIASCSLPFLKSYSRFLRAVLGGSSEEDKIYFVSKDSMALIFEELLRKLISPLWDSSFSWAKDACSLLLRTEDKDSISKSLFHNNMLEAAQFAFEVLKSSFFCLMMFVGEYGVVSSISAAIFMLDWEYRMSAQVDSNSVTDENDEDDDSQANRDPNLGFGESFHSFRLEVSSDFWKSINVDNRKKLANILVQTIRSAIFETYTANTYEAPTLCCEWMLEVLEYICPSRYEEQSLLDQLLDDGKTWASWVMLAHSDGTRVASLKFGNPRHTHEYQFVDFIVKLISKLGCGRVIAGTAQETSSSSLEVQETHAFSRSWLAAEVLCTWKWPGGSAVSSFLPSLCEFAKAGNSPQEDNLLNSIVNTLLDGALVNGDNVEPSFLNVWPASDDEIESIQDPFLRALVSLLLALFIKDNVWTNDKAAVFLKCLNDKLFFGTTINTRCLRILPFLTSVIIRRLRRGLTESDEDAPLEFPKENQVHNIIQGWLQKTQSLPPLNSSPFVADTEQWVQLVISCYSLSSVGGVSALKMASQKDVKRLEKTLLVDLFRKHRSGGDALTSATTQSSAVQITLEKLTSVCVGYCWKELNDDDWEFVLSQLRRQTDSAVLALEEVAESVNDAVVNYSATEEVIKTKLEEVVRSLDPSPINIARNSLFTYTLFYGLLEQQEEDSSASSLVKADKWSDIKEKILDSVLRLFFATGVTEAIAGSEDCSSIIASSRHACTHFWELVSFIVINSPEHVKVTAIQSMEMWELSKGYVSSLYAILFSAKPIHSLQVAAYIMLSTDPISHLAITEEDASSPSGDASTSQEDVQSPNLSLSSDENIPVRDEISRMIIKSPSALIEGDLISHHRVNVFTAWALLLCHLQSLASASPARQKLVQWVQDFADTQVLDCLFEHIPLQSGAMRSSKKKDVELPAGVSEAAAAAKRAITTGSLLFAIESLWSIGTEEMSSLAGALYGSMLHVLPAYVRDWYTRLRDQSTSSAIELFTKAYCSPLLLADELSQIKKAALADENFSVCVSKSAYEVVATYKKEETGIDLVIRLPASYPLLPVDVECPKSLGISELKRRKWLFSMLAFVRSQNGALAEAIRTWKNNFDKEFEGIEECPICYSIIHTANNSIPRLACKTCKHKFHSACLYKWFSTSHKSTCPLCQSPF